MIFGVNIVLIIKLSLCIVLPGGYHRSGFSVYEKKHSILTLGNMGGIFYELVELKQGKAERGKKRK
jgi:hypothetical protein